MLERWLTKLIHCVTISVQGRAYSADFQQFVLGFRFGSLSSSAQNAVILLSIDIHRLFLSCCGGRVCIRLLLKVLGLGWHLQPSTLCKTEAYSD